MLHACPHAAACLALARLLGIREPSSSVTSSIKMISVHTHHSSNQHAGVLLNSCCCWLLLSACVGESTESRRLHVALHQHMCPAVCIGTQCALSSCRSRCYRIHTAVRIQLQTSHYVQCGLRAVALQSIVQGHVPAVDHNTRASGSHRYSADGCYKHLLIRPASIQQGSKLLLLNTKVTEMYVLGTSTVLAHGSFSTFTAYGQVIVANPCASSASSRQTMHIACCILMPSTQQRQAPWCTTQHHKESIKHKQPLMIPRALQLLRRAEVSTWPEVFSLLAAGSAAAASAASRCCSAAAEGLLLQQR
jgi:hypothetical protein